MGVDIAALGTVEAEGNHQVQGGVKTLWEIIGKICRKWAISVGIRMGMLEGIIDQLILYG